MGSFILGGTKVTPSSANDTWPAGYYDANTITGIDGLLIPGNVKNGINIFGVTGTVVPGSSSPYPLKDTGITGVSATGDDGSHQVNIPSYSQVGNCLVDNRTNLMWPIDFTLATSIGLNNVTWINAINACEASTYDGHTGWRMPNLRELITLIDYPTDNYSVVNVLLSNLGVGEFWSSTSMESANLNGHTGNAYTVRFSAIAPSDGSYLVRDQTWLYASGWVTPVRYAS